MTLAHPEVGIAFTCGLDGTIIDVIRDELGVSDRISPGRALSTVVDRGSLGKTLNFIVEIKMQGAAFDWQLGVPIAGRISMLSFAGIISGERLLIVAAKTADGLEKLVEDLMKIGNEQINRLRSAMKDRAALSIEKAQQESYLYDELGRLNNELANLQRELAKKNVELEKLNEEKNRFLGIAAHDLRNPLNAIQIYSEFLLDETSSILDPEHVEFVSIIHASSQFMLQLVNDLLDVAKIESGKLQLELAPTDLAALVQRNVALNSVMASKKSITLRLLAHGNIHELMLDASKIEQILNNLITNAVKFSNAGSFVDVGIEGFDKEVVISVKDEGQGIPANERDKLFEPFQRTSVKTTAGEGSTGLGLAIVRKIALGHGGRVWVESEVGRGTTFYVALPLP
jgi:two-component system, OmpR family, sensor kinase